MRAPKAILWIMPEAPQNPGLGSALRQYWIIRGAREALPDTRFICVSGRSWNFEEGMRRGLDLFDEVHWVTSAGDGVEASASTVFSKLAPYDFAYAASWWLDLLRPLRHKCVEVLDANPDIDVVHIEHLNLAPIAVWLRRYTQAPIALSVHNTFSLMAGAEGHEGSAVARLGRRMLGLAASAAHLTPAVWYDAPRNAVAKMAVKLSSRVDIRRASLPLAVAMDAWYSAKADLVLCMSEQESMLLSQMGNPTFVAPNGASSAFLEPVLQARSALAATEAATPVYGFVGTGAYPPYQAASKLLLETFIASPELGRLRIAGFEMGKHVGALPEYARCPKATVVNSPPELRPYLVDLEAMVMPIFSGAGTRLKVVEAVFAGIPIIGSRKAVEGLRLEPERDYVLIDEATPASVEKAIRRYQAQRAYYYERVMTLREKWLEQYDWLSIGGRVAGALSQLRTDVRWGRHAEPAKQEALRA